MAEGLTVVTLCAKNALHTRTIAIFIDVERKDLDYDEARRETWYYEKEGRQGG